MPCLLAPRVYVKRSLEAPDHAYARIDGCPFEAEREPDFLSTMAMQDLTSTEKRYALDNVEKHYEDPQDFRPSGYWKNHTLAFIDRR